MIDPFIIKALIAGCGMALMCGPLGCFIAWQRMAYFGDTIAHSALLGIVLSLVFSTNLYVGILFVAVAISFAVYFLEKEKRLASDTLLGVFAHGALALGLVILSLQSQLALNLNALLFGDILAVNSRDIAIIYLFAGAICGMLVLQWRNFMRFIIHPDIAAVEGVNVRRMKLMLMLSIAITVAVSIKIVGILLITSMLIIPAASMRYFAKTPTQMTFLSIVAGIASVCGGLYGSLSFDTPTGPSIILAALAIFIVAYAASRSRSSTTGA